MFFVFRCYLLPFQVVTLYVLNVPERHRKNTSFPWTRKRIDYFSFSGVLQQPCHALPLIPRPSGTPLKGGRAGIYGCGLLYLSLFQHYIRQQTTANDYSLIPMIIAGADEIVQGKYPDTVVYRRSLEREYYYVECTRMGRKRLAMKTFYKTKIGG